MSQKSKEIEKLVREVISEIESLSGLSDPVNEYKSDFTWCTQRLLKAMKLLKDNP